MNSTLVSRNLFLLHQNGSLSACKLSFSRKEPWHLLFEGNEMPEIIFDNADLFECLTNLRLKLEISNLLILCNGSVRNIYPSGMSREMSGGRLAYRIHLGKPTTRDDIIDIFEPASPSDVVKVIEQEEFHQQWMRSL